MSHRLDFKAIPWNESGKGVRQKVFVHESQQIRIVEFAYGFIEEAWCLKGHTAYVLDGEFSIDYSGFCERYHAGDVIFIPRGEQDKHKAILEKNQKVTLLFFEVLENAE